MFDFCVTFQELIETLHVPAFFTDYCEEAAFLASESVAALTHTSPVSFDVCFIQSFIIFPVEVHLTCPPPFSLFLIHFCCSGLFFSPGLFPFLVLRNSQYLWSRYIVLLPWLRCLDMCCFMKNKFSIAPFILCWVCSWHLISVVGVVLLGASEPLQAASGT